MVFRSNTDDYNLFMEVLEFTLAKEGGLNDDKDDGGNRGGVTWKGITPGTLKRAREAGITRAERTQDLSDHDIEQIYYYLYWRAAHCNEIPDPLCFVMFDIAVNSGTGGAVRALQETINDMFKADCEVSVDGAWGPQTKHAVLTLEKADKVIQGSGVGEILDTLPVLAACIMLYERAETYVEIEEKHPEYRKYFYGWLKNRVKCLGKRLGF